MNKCSSDAANALNEYYFNLRKKYKNLEDKNIKEAKILKRKLQYLQIILNSRYGNCI